MANSSQQEIPEDQKHRRPPPPAPIDWSKSSEHILKTYVKDHRSAISSAAASIAGTLSGYPLDTIKTRVQGQSTSTAATASIPKDVNAKTATPKTGVTLPKSMPAETQFKPWKYAWSMLQEEGVRALFKGMAAPLVSTCAVRVFTFTWYQNTKYIMDEYYYDRTGVSVLQQCNTKWASPTWTTFKAFAAAGAMSGGLSTIVSCPFELTKIAAQLPSAPDKPTKGVVNPLDEKVKASYKGKGTFGVMGALIKNRGPAGLYSGVSYQLGRDVLGTAAYFSGYEVLKMWLTVYRGKPADDRWCTFTAGGLAGIASHIVCYPLDTVKTRYQRNCLRHHASTTKNPPIEFMKRAAWRGFTVGLVRSGITHAFLFATFEYVKKAVNGLDLPVE